MKKIIILSLLIAPAFAYAEQPLTGEVTQHTYIEQHSGAVFQSNNTFSGSQVMTHTVEFGDAGISESVLYDWFLFIVVSSSFLLFIGFFAGITSGKKVL